MKDLNYKAAIEAILFAMGEPISIIELSEALEINSGDTKEILAELVSDYQGGNRGIQLIQMNSKVQLCTKPEHHQYIDQLMKERSQSGLSQAGLETLAIIAYKQPVTRIEIDGLRGVKSSSSIQTLVDRNLIKEAGRLDAPGKPFLYETTLEFLKYAGISHIEDLPEYEDFVAIVQEADVEEVAIESTEE